MANRMNESSLGIARRSAVAMAVGLMVASGTVYAQSNATGSVFGTIKARSGSTVVIENVATGQKRTLTPDANGRVSASSLPPGTYRAMLVSDGKVVSTRNNVEVLIGQGAEIAFDTTATLDTVEVTGARKTIDVSNTNNGASFTSKQLEALPTARTVASIIQLAPQTTQADSRYANGAASFGGGAATENSYYINGFPVTNAWAQLGASELPFGAIGQAQILTGGFGAEFGRSIGGVVNITTKSGGNQWEGGVSASIDPSFLRAAPKDIYHEKTGAALNASTDGTLLFRRAENKTTRTSVGGYVGGPLIKDHLFFFAAVERIKNDIEEIRLSRTTDANSLNKWGWRKAADVTDRSLAKFDWNINDDHRVELTMIGDRSKREEKLYGYDYGTFSHGNTANATFNYTNASGVTPIGADVQILKYTGNITDDLLVTALTGRSQSPHSFSAPDYDVFDPLHGVPVVSALASRLPPGFTPQNFQPISASTDLIPAGAKDKVSATRLDVEYRIGSHSLRAGLDKVNLGAENSGRKRLPAWTYLKSASAPTTPIAMSRGPNVAPASGGGQGVNGYYAQLRILDFSTDARSIQDAWYLEDKWQVHKNVQLTAGLRHESFKNQNGDGETFLHIKDQWSPRFAAAWDVNGDASLKVSGTVGRYAIQTPSQMAERFASRSTLTQQFFTYTGYDAATGAPTGLTKLTEPRSSNNELGQKKNLATLVPTDLRPSYQDEMTLGIEKALTNKLNVGAKFTYRTLRSAIDDFGDDRPFIKWVEEYNKANPGSPINPDNWPAFSGAAFNPGYSNTFYMNFNGDDKPLTKVTLEPRHYVTKDGVGFEKAQRVYKALDLFVEHPYRDGWYGKINYTWSRNTGNTEGQTQSDAGQADVSKTFAWDFPELMLHSSGVLPNHRAHQIKAYGYVDLNPQVTVGANALLASGRPRTCLGNIAPDMVDYGGYGSDYKYCEGAWHDRGTMGYLPWEMRLDVNLTYKPAAVKGLALRADVFNVFDRQSARNVDETYNSGNAVSPTYGRVISYTTPRSVRLTVTYERQF